MKTYCLNYSIEGVMTFDSLYVCVEASTKRQAIEIAQKYLDSRNDSKVSIYPFWTLSPEKCQFYTKVPVGFSNEYYISQAHPIKDNSVYYYAASGIAGAIIGYIGAKSNKLLMAGVIGLASIAGFHALKKSKE